MDIRANKPNEGNKTGEVLGGGQLRKREGGFVAPTGEPNEWSAAIAVFHRGDCDSNGPATLQTLNSHTAQDFACYVCAFIWDWQSWPRKCYQCGELEGAHQ